MTRLLFRGSNLFFFRMSKVVPVAKSVQVFYKPISPKQFILTIQYYVVNQVIWYCISYRSEVSCIGPRPKTCN